MTFAGVASNFAGVPLALAFIFTLGQLGLVTVWLHNCSASTSTSDRLHLYTKLGLELVYLYFQLPLMVLIIAPAIDGLKKEWREAAENMGASSPPVLAARGPADPDAVDPRQRHPALRQRVRRPGDGLPADGRPDPARRRS